MQRRGSARLLVACGVVAATCLFAGPIASAASPTRHVLHVCDCPESMAAEERAELLAALSAFGYEQGRNLDLVTRDSTAAKVGYAAFLARQVGRLKPDLILASGVRVATGAKETADRTPVLFWRVTDPVGEGLVDGLARPGGKLTGFSRAIAKLTAKRLELLRQMLPSAQRVGFLYINDYPSHQRQAAEVNAAALPLGLKIADYGLPNARWTPAELERTFASMRRDGMDAFLSPDANVLPQELIRLAAAHRLPTVHPLTHNVTDWGGLASYSTAGQSMLDVAAYADRLLKGARPADLPVQEPARFELVLNARAARAFGVSFPTVFLLQATRVVEK